MIRTPGFLSVMMWLSCLGGTNLEMPATVKVEELGNYQVQGNRLVLSGNPKITRYCIGDTLGEDVLSGTDSIEFFLRGDTLTVYLDRQFTDGGAQVQNSRILVRSPAGGTGLPGTWLYVMPAYRVVSGMPTAAEMALVEQGIEVARRELAFGTITWNISAQDIMVQEDIRWAFLFMARWNGVIGGGPPFADSAVFDIAVRATSKTTVELKGRLTGETVRLTGWPNGDRIYSGDGPGQTVFQYFSSPLGCPNPLEPPWYLDFLAGNRKIVNIPAL